MGNALKIVTEADFRQGYRRITSRDLNDRLLESTPAIDSAVSQTGSKTDTVATQSPWQPAAIFKISRRLNARKLSRAQRSGNMRAVS